MNAQTPIRKISRGDPAIEMLRDALGAVAIAPPLAYSLTRSGSNWQLRRLDQRIGIAFENRETAVAAMRRAVVRAAAYCLVVEGCTGAIDVQFLHWGPEAARLFGIRP
jgi:hypothetical protein